jgi:hypothetical protein
MQENRPFGQADRKRFDIAGSQAVKRITDRPVRFGQNCHTKALWQICENTRNKLRRLGFTSAKLALS